MSKWKINIWLENTKKQIYSSNGRFSQFFFPFVVVVHVFSIRVHHFNRFECIRYVSSVSWAFCLLIYRVRNLIKRIFDWKEEKYHFACQNKIEPYHFTCIRRKSFFFSYTHSSARSTNKEYTHHQFTQPNIFTKCSEFDFALFHRNSFP